MRIAHILMLCFFFWGACSNNPVLHYNDRLALEQMAIEQAIDSLSKCIEYADIAEIEKKYYAIQKTIASGYKFAEECPAFESDSSFSQEFALYCKKYETKLAVLVPLVKKTYQIPDSEYTYSYHNKLEKELQDFNQFRKINLNYLKLVQADFAMKYNFRIDTLLLVN